MAKLKYMTGEELEKREEARYLKFHPIAVWRARLLAKKLYEVMKKYPEIRGILLKGGKVFCFNTKKEQEHYKAVAIFKLWVVPDMRIIPQILKLHGIESTPCEEGNFALSYQIYEKFYCIENV